MATHDDQAFRKPRTGRFGQINNFGDVCQVIARKSHGIRLPLVDHAEVVAVSLSLQIDDLNVVPCVSASRSNQLKAKWFQP